jgi:hypothetical protein
LLLVNRGHFRGEIGAERDDGAEPQRDPNIHEQNAEPKGDGATGHDRRGWYLIRNEYAKE